ncbi:hypothetical protein NKG94_07985 [Micromonospora sp. M12]
MKAEPDAQLVDEAAGDPEPRPTTVESKPAAKSRTAANKARRPPADRPATRPAASDPEVNGGAASLGPQPARRGSAFWVTEAQGCHA